MKNKELLLFSKIDDNGKKRFPWLYIPTIYFAEGLPWVIVNIVSVAMYSVMGVSNSQIGLITGYIGFVWTLKMLWSPFVDSYSKKRTWLIFMQFLIGISTILLGLSLFLDSFFVVSALILTLIAFLSATNDISIDGYYMISLTDKQQAFFVGIRNLFWRFALISAGLIILLAGIFEEKYGLKMGWSYAFFTCSLIFIILATFHYFYLPDFEINAKSKNSGKQNNSLPFIKIFKMYIKQDNMGVIILFILLYRFGEAMVTKMLFPFLLNSKEVGGLGLSTIELGFIQSTVGVWSLMVGGILGGWVLYKYGLKKCIWPMAIAMNLPNFLYLYLSIIDPEMWQIYLSVGIEQFGYGLGLSAFMMYLLIISKGKYQTSFYAISTGFMAIGLNIPGMISGYLQEWLGYSMFFLVVTILAIPGLITIYYLPLKDEMVKK